MSRINNTFIDEDKINDLISNKSASEEKVNEIGRASCRERV